MLCSVSPDLAGGPGRDQKRFTSVIAPAADGEQVRADAE